MRTNHIYQGDVLTVLKTFPDETIDCVVTSPPYWSLRDYGTDSQLGLEPTFDEYITKLCSIFDEIQRVLKKEGTCWVNLGDTYGGSWQNYGAREGHQRRKNTRSFNRAGNPKEIIPPSARMTPKCLLQIPFRFAIAMTERYWILRNVIIWHKPNCMPASVKDRFTVDYEPVFFFVKSKKYWFEQQFEDFSDTTIPRMFRGVSKNNKWVGGPDGQTKHTMSQPRENETKYFKENYGGSGTSFKGHSGYRRADGKLLINPKGRNKRCVWTIPTQPFKEAHFAIFPEKLIEPMIKAGCPHAVCVKCGRARERLLKREGLTSREWQKIRGLGPKGADSKMGIQGKSIVGARPPDPKYKTIGWTKCNCDAEFKPGIVLDPFMGSGTTAVVARKLGRQFVGIELSKEYIKIAEKRLRQQVLF